MVFDANSNNNNRYSSPRTAVIGNNFPVGNPSQRPAEAVVALVMSMTTQQMEQERTKCLKRSM